MNAKTETTVPVLSSIGIDIGKDVFHLVGFDARGKIILRKKIKRLALAETFKKIPPGHGSLPERAFRQPELASARP